MLKNVEGRIHDKERNGQHKNIQMERLEMKTKIFEMKNIRWEQQYIK